MRVFLDHYRLVVHLVRDSVGYGIQTVGRRGRKNGLHVIAEIDSSDQTNSK